MTGTEVALIITASAAWVTGVGGVVLQFMGQSEARKDRAEIKEQMKAVQTATNGVVEHLGIAKLAQGIAEGKAVGLEQGRKETGK
jgi:flagellar biosynthesis/type III secretory pathway protein FliH